MTMTLTENTGISSASSNKDALELKNEAQTTSDGPNFAQYLSDLFQRQEDKLTNPAAEMPAGVTAAFGQEIADPTGSAEVAARQVTDWQLQAVTLGPNLNVITPTSSAPDAQSLEAFARAQGLDEKAVHWLFGGDAPQSQTRVQANATDPHWLAMTPTHLPFGATSTQAVDAAPGGLTGHDPLTATAGIFSEKPANDPSKAMMGSAMAGVQAMWTMADGSTVAEKPANESPTGMTGSATAGVQAMWTMTDGSTVTEKPANESSKGLLGSAMAGVQALWAMADGSEDSKKPVTPTPTSTEDVPTMQMLRMPPPAAIWMQRTAMNLAASDPQTNTKESAISLSDLDLGAEWGGDVLQALLAGEGNAASGSSATGTHGTAYANFAARWDAQVSNRNDLAPHQNPAAEQTDAAVRSENIQNLADKMGQAVGQRILSEMERGQWHLKLSLRPATLGHIEVEMRMRSGEFDAVFTAPNAVTRDLLQDGMNKLRETLGQMGMDVANIHVGDGQTGRSGGDSTPGFSRGKPASKEAIASETTPETTRAPSVKDPNDGLDVLV
jgi:hypothetical protein